MTAVHLETIATPGGELQQAEVDESARELTKELFRRESSVKIEVSKIQTKKDETPRQKLNSGIPRLRAGPPKPRATSYLPKCAPIGPTLCAKTLEMQFLNNKKRLHQLHADLLTKQRPLLEIHKSLLRTKKQLEGLGKKVTLDDLKVISLETDQKPDAQDGSGENPVAETTMQLKSSIENALESCAKACKTCFAKNEHMLELLESTASLPEEKVEEFKKDTTEMGHSIDTTIKENERKIEELLHNWEKSVNFKNTDEEITAKLSAMEETIKVQQKTLNDNQDTIHSLNRKLDEKRSGSEKTLLELQEKLNKADEDLKKEKKTSNDNIMKVRTMRAKVADLELKLHETEQSASTKTKQMEEQLRHKELQLVKEKDSFRQKEAHIVKQFEEKQNQLDTRIKSSEELHQLQNASVREQFDGILKEKEQELHAFKQEKEEFTLRAHVLEEETEVLRLQLEECERVIEELKVKEEAKCAPNLEKSWEEEGLKEKIKDLESTLKKQDETIVNMQSSLKAHAQLAANLKLEKDTALQYSNELGSILKEARETIEDKTRLTYNFHEKLVLREKECKKLRQKLKECWESDDVLSEKWEKSRCQICMASLRGRNSSGCSSCIETEVRRRSSPQYVSDSLIGMSVRKVDHLRTRLDNLKKLKIPPAFDIELSCSRHSCPAPPLKHSLRKQIESRGKLYKILQKHADQSYEDFINLLKLTVSRGANELKPSNEDEKTDCPYESSSSTFRFFKETCEEFQGSCYDEE